MECTTKFSSPFGGGQQNKRESPLALIPPFFLDCVVAIGQDTGAGRKRWVASGFLYGEFVEQVTPTEKGYRVYLVTNRHVLEGIDGVHLRFNPEADEPAREFSLQLRKPDNTLIWFPHPDAEIDVAVVPINASALREERIRFSYFQSDAHIADRAKAINLGLTEGDGIFTLGFPMELVGKLRNFVIVRQGSIARIRDTLVGTSKEFLADAFVFPGNSGGPVVTKPEAMAIQGTQRKDAAYLIGVVKGYIPYREVAISEQTRRPRITFEENSGLAAVIPIDYIREAIQAHLKTLQKESQQ